jgi:hypothetical protein
MRSFCSRSLKWDAQPKKPHPGNPPSKKLFVRQLKKANSSKAHSQLAASEKALPAACKQMALAHKLYVKAKSDFLKADTKISALEAKAAKA